MVGFGSIGEFAIGEVGVGAGGGAEFIGPDKYMQPLSEPVRFRRGPRANQQQFAAAFNPIPIVPFAWYVELSKPPRPIRPRLNPSEVPFFSFQPMPSPFVATGWFTPLSEPVRRRRGLPMSLYQFFATDPTVIPTGRVMPWFNALSEPVRFRVGLRPSLQQFYAAPPRLLPTPTLFGTLSALEIKDTFLAGAVSFNRPISGELGVQNRDRSPGEVSISNQAPPLRARMSIRTQ